MADERESGGRWSERRFRSLVDATATEVFHNTPDGRLISDMPQWRRLTGQTAAEIEGFGWLDAIHPDDAPAVDAAWRGAVAGGTVFDSEYRIRRSDGGWAHLWVRSAPLRDDDGRVVEYIGLYHDVTERVEQERTSSRLQRDLDLESHILERVVRETPVGIALFWGPEHRFRVVNEAYLATVPAAGRTLVGRPMAEALPEAVEQVPLLDRVRAGERVPTAELEVPFGGPEAVDGARHYRVALSPVTEPDGAPGGVLATVVEITEEITRRRGLERELERERAVAEMLQRSLLPDALPDIPGVELFARYEPAGPGAFVGGDWYDVFDTGKGGIAFAVGDVAGRGLQAATVMGQLRAALRAYAFEDPAPGSVVGRMDELVDRLGGTATLAYGLFDVDAGRLVQTLAGHPPPLLVGAPGASRWLEDGLGAPLGAAVGPRAAGGIDVPHDGLLLYYTDGLLAERELGIRSGMLRLQEMAETAGAGRPDLAAVCAALLATEDGQEDDRALLAVRRR